MYGVGFLLILGQFSGLVGYSPETNNSVLPFFETFMNIGKWDFSAVLISFPLKATDMALRKMIIIPLTKLDACGCSSGSVFFACNSLLGFRNAVSR